MTWDHYYEWRVDKDLKRRVHGLSEDTTPCLYGLRKTSLRIASNPHKTLTGYLMNTSLHGYGYINLFSNFIYSHVVMYS